MTDATIQPQALIPYDDIQTRKSRGAIGITAITRLKHADLWAAAKKFETPLRGSKTARYGGQSAMARKLKVHACELGRWINLLECPPKEPRGKWTAKRLMRLEAELFELTGKTMEELFPDELRANVQFLRSPRQFERTAQIEHEALEQYAIATRDRMLASQNITIDQPTNEDLSDKLLEALQKLTPRQRDVLRYRFGLGGENPHTLDECAQIFMLHRERIRQIEAKAIQTLQRSVGEDLLCFLSEGAQEDIRAWRRTAFGGFIS